MNVPLVLVKVKEGLLMRYVGRRNTDTFKLLEGDLTPEVVEQVRRTPASMTPEEPKGAA